MRWHAWGLPLLLAALAGGGAGAGALPGAWAGADLPSSDPVTHFVDIVGFVYDPSPLVIRMGDTVVWTNRDVAQHTVTSWDLTWSSDYLRQGESYARTFPLPGAVMYRCLPHASMHGQLLVLPPDA